MMLKRLDVLLIEDNRGDFILVRDMLDEARAGIELVWAETLTEGLERIAAEAPDLLLLDLGLPESSGLETFARMHKMHPEIPTVVMTGLDDSTIATAAVRAGAQDYLVKGQVEATPLARSIRHAIERKQVEDRLRMSRAVLERLNKSDFTSNAIRDILLTIKEGTGLEAVAIRLGQGDDFPYFETNGFPAHFVQKENYLCQRDKAGEIVLDREGNPILECMCGNVLQRRTDTSKPFFTAGGSYWTNGTTEFLATTTEKDRQSRTRNRCNREGYESVALIPLRAGSEIVGLLQFNDHRLNRFTPEMISFFEGLGSSIGIARARSRAEDALRESEEKFASIFNASVDAIIACDDKLMVHLWNPAAEKLFGYTAEEMIGECILRILPATYAPSGVAPFEEYAALGGGALVGKTVEMKGLAKDEREFPIELTFSPTRMGGALQATAIIRDISERKKLEDQFNHSQKLEAVGQLAGGIAHDFNNLLTGILGYSEFLGASFAPGSKEAGDLEEIIKAARRAAELTSSILAFSRRQVITLEKIDLNGLVKRIIKLLRRIIGEDIEIDFIAGHELGTVEVDPGQIEQVILNIGTNARDAMPRGGRLTIETENVVLNGVYCETHLWARPGRFVILSVTDTGCGMSEDVLAHVFEPFFTTKEVGKGTGLGLASVHGIISQHNGVINVYSEVGKGTTFKIYLPIVERAASKVGNKVAKSVARGAETILVAEDDELLRKMVTRLLTQRGYKVIAASNGIEAVEEYGKNRDKIALVLMDIVMPRMGGKEAAEEMRKINPKIRVLFSSGYSASTVTNQHPDEPDLEMVPKPYNPDDLLRKVREILDRK